MCVYVDLLVQVGVQLSHFCLKKMNIGLISPDATHTRSPQKIKHIYDSSIYGRGVSMGGATCAEYMHCIYESCGFCCKCMNIVTSSDGSVSVKRPRPVFFMLFLPCAQSPSIFTISSLFLTWKWAVEKPKGILSLCGKRGVGLTSCRAPRPAVHVSKRQRRVLAIICSLHAAHQSN